MRHIVLDPDRFEDRSLMEVCDFCGAVAGAPCYNESKTGYWCPSDGCDQLYETRRDALNCMMCPVVAEEK